MREKNNLSAFLKLYIILNVQFMDASIPNEEAWWWNIVAEISKWHKFMLNQLHNDNCCLLLLSSKNQMSRQDLLAKHQLPCSKSLAGCSPCSRHPAAAWVELLHSPAGWWPARSHSSYWPEPPSCGGTDVNITARHRRICALKTAKLKHIDRRTWTPALAAWPPLSTVHSYAASLYLEFAS